MFHFYKCYFYNLILFLYIHKSTPLSVIRDEIDEINPEHAKQVLDIMLDLLRQKAESQEHFIVRIKLEEIYQNLQVNRADEIQQ